MNCGLAGFTTRITRFGIKFFENLGSHLFCIAANADCDLFGQADAIRIDVHLDNFGCLWPIIHAVTRKRGKRIEARAECQHYVSLGNQFHSCLGAIVAKRAD